MATLNYLAAFTFDYCVQVYYSACNLFSWLYIPTQAVIRCVQFKWHYLYTWSLF